MHIRQQRMTGTALASFVAIVLALSAAPASAAVIEYTSSTASNAAVSGATTHNFEGIAPAGGFVGGDQTVGGVTFSAPCSNAAVVDANAAYGHHNASFFTGVDGYITSNVTATRAGATAIGLTYGSFLILIGAGHRDPQHRRCVRPHNTAEQRCR
jgi:hypothetical protein